MKFFNPELGRNSKSELSFSVAHFAGSTEVVFEESVELSETEKNLVKYFIRNDI